MAIKNQLYFIEPSSLQMEGIYYLHEHILTLLCGIIITVSIFYGLVVNKGFGSKIINKTLTFFYVEEKIFVKDINHDTKRFLEIFWTVVPAFILIYIAGPSFALLYSMDEIAPESFFTILVQGSQWYWSYEYYLPFFTNMKICTSSYMISDLDIELGQIRLLSVTNSIFIPRDLPVRFLVTANDVLHSWAVPSLGIKVDAVPGRLNQIIVESYKSGIFYGQCSEICGTNHAFMPITVYCLSPVDLMNFFGENSEIFS